MILTEAKHTPRAPPISEHTTPRSPDARLRCPFALCYVRESDGLAVVVGQFSHLRRGLVQRARRMAATGTYPLDRLYIWDSTLSVWPPRNHTEWCPVAPTDAQQWWPGRT